MKDKDAKASLSRDHFFPSLTVITTRPDDP